ncbi:MAG: hypothetical protein NDI61_03605 [Bdellovibrionaceae bacterium]|nr:hypothetical protein [Pseudobdellovibrionaceae bacterium]
MNIPVGDKHNFGRCTFKVSRGEDLLFVKPRPVFWEWLFFGVDSPLTNAFGRLPGLNSLLSTTMLEVSDPFKMSGSSVKEIETGSVYNPDRLSSALGSQLAYATLFGITDLHRNNIITTPQQTIVPIDVECVLMPLRLGNETGLLPHRVYDTNQCLFLSLSSQAVSANSFALRMLSEFVAIFDQMLENLETIRSALRPHQDVIDTCPIRVILRPTREYAQYLEKAVLPQIGFVEEEMIQLRRGDIPYFFTTSVSQHIFYYLNSELSESAPVSGKDAQGFVAPLDVILEKANLQKLFAATTLWICSRLLNGPVQLNIGAVRIERSKHTAVVQIGASEYKTALA